MLDFDKINNSKMILNSKPDMHNFNDGATWRPYVSISHNNNKLGTATASVSLLVQCTCNNKLPCYKDCYAKRMEIFRPSIHNAWLNNYLVYKNNPQLFFDSVLTAMLQSLYFRFFVGGDIPDIDFLKLALDTAKRAPNCKVLMFTKKFWFINQYLDGGGVIPDNVTIILSSWQNYKINNKYNLPIAYVINKDGDKIQNTYTCNGNCTFCQASARGCWYLKTGDSVTFKKH